MKVLLRANTRMGLVLRANVLRSPLEIRLILQDMGLRNVRVDDADHAPGGALANFAREFPDVLLWAEGDWPSAAMEIPDEQGQFRIIRADPIGVLPRVGAPRMSAGVVAIWGTALLATTLVARWAYDRLR